MYIHIYTFYLKIVFIKRHVKYFYTYKLEKKCLCAHNELNFFINTYTLLFNI